jgi:hypothetical protein
VSVREGRERAMVKEGERRAAMAKEVKGMVSVREGRERALVKERARRAAMAKEVKGMVPLLSRAAIQSKEEDQEE